MRMTQDEWWRKVGRRRAPAVDFGEAVEDALLDHGWNQRQLAELMRDLGVWDDASQTRVSRIVSGKRPVSVDEVVALAHLIGVHPDPIRRLFRTQEERS